MLTLAQQCAQAIARAHLYEAEKAARESAETASRMKDEFLAVLSHELRTPLNSMLGWSKLLRTRKFDEATTARALETIERNAKLQSQLIEDILDVSRIIRGKLRLNIRPSEIVTVIESAIEAILPAANAKSIQVESIINRSVGLVSADGDRLQQVIWNLLSNAIKFTPDGGLVTIRLAPADSYVQIQVSDTGMGISAEFLPYVFERFRQADASTTRAHAGLGLGLAIVRNLVELHGRTISVESPGVGQGATFTVQLPLPSDSRIVGAGLEDNLSRKQTIFPQNPPSSGSGGEFSPPHALTPSLLAGLQVLVVDDETE